MNGLEFQSKDKSVRACKARLHIGGKWVVMGGTAVTEAEKVLDELRSALRRVEKSLEAEHQHGAQLLHHRVPGSQAGKRDSSLPRQDITASVPAGSEAPATLFSLASL